MKRLVILGSTGSIGQNTLDVVRRFPDRFQVLGLSAYSNIDELCRQVREFRPGFVCVGNSRLAEKLGAKISPGIKLFCGEEGLLELAGLSSADEVVVAISGSQALGPLLSAIETGKDIVLANKEALVMAGPLVMQKARKHKISLKPVDSEQSAIWQCLDKQDKRNLKTIYLTASGGPLRKVPKGELRNISVPRALNHPRWKMGKKISVDSATLMNKGLEVLETMYLFGVGPQEIKVIIHPEAVVHSMVEFIDGVVMAQLSATDMRIPIQYALTYPERLACGSPAGIDFLKLRKLEFQEPDFKKFPCLGLAYTAARKQGGAPCVLNAANEVAVEAFLERRLAFNGLARVVERVLAKHRSIINSSLKDILKLDAWAREEAAAAISKLRN
ncbi:MAG: 1-deoxy-D-xylulose-5-phosphate reductoisomerase [Candidatus Omnitrophica bacterium]|nr:1-deoxy-D-xylulose-5-phosphate reductoisomerase [Candidatus Omnitrophota bacterium]